MSEPAVDLNAVVHHLSQRIAALHVDLALRDAYIDQLRSQTTEDDDDAGVQPPATGEREGSPVP